MSTEKRLISIVSGALAAVALASPAGAAEPDAQLSIRPGEVRVFMCDWGYGPIAHEHALRIDGRALEVRRVRRTSPAGDRVAFSHRVTVREALGRYRAVYNRGRRTVEYRDSCPSGAAD